MVQILPASSTLVFTFQALLCAEHLCILLSKLFCNWRSASMTEIELIQLAAAGWFHLWMASTDHILKVHSKRLSENQKTNFEHPAGLWICVPQREVTQQITFEMLVNFKSSVCYDKKVFVSLWVHASPRPCLKYFSVFQSQSCINGMTLCGIRKALKRTLCSLANHSRLSFAPNFPLNFFSFNQLIVCLSFFWDSETFSSFQDLAHKSMNWPSPTLKEKHLCGPGLKLIFCSTTGLQTQNNLICMCCLLTPKNQHCT